MIKTTMEGHGADEILGKRIKYLNLKMHFLFFSYGEHKLCDDSLPQISVNALPVKEHGGKVFTHIGPFLGQINHLLYYSGGKYRRIM